LTEFGPVAQNTSYSFRFVGKTLARLSFLTPEWLAAKAAIASDHEIGQELGVDGASIRYHRRKHGIPSFTELTGQMKVKDSWEPRRRGVHTRASSDNLLVDYFDNVDTPEKAYWIGVLATDGCVSENSRISLSQVVADGVLVDHFATAVGAQMFLKTRTVENQGFLGKDKTKIQRVVRFTSKQMGSALAREGITQRKTKTLALSPCSSRYPQGYLRGCLDGDGSVGKINFHFSSGSESWIDEARDLIAGETGKSLAKYRRISSSTGREVFVLQGVRGDKAVLDWIYSDAGGPARLERKYKRYLDYWVNKVSSYWKDKVGARALVEALPAGLASASIR
jgi:hypothetical protein